MEPPVGVLGCARRRRRGGRGPGSSSSRRLRLSNVRAGLPIPGDAPAPKTARHGWFALCCGIEHRSEHVLRAACRRLASLTRCQEADVGAESRGSDVGLVMFCFCRYLEAQTTRWSCSTLFCNPHGQRTTVTTDSLLGPTTDSQRDSGPRDEHL